MEVYLAGPFFNEAQRKVITEIERLLQYNAIGFFSPSKDTPGLKMADASFAMNCLAIQKANIVLAVIDDFDTGTMWEMGYAFGLGKKVVAVTMVKDRGLNLMLAKCCVGFIQGVEELKTVLMTIGRNQETIPWRMVYGGKLQ